jgi:hypothetical protein
MLTLCSLFCSISQPSSGMKWSLKIVCIPVYKPFGKSIWQIVWWLQRRTKCEWSKHSTKTLWFWRDLKQVVWYTKCEVM